MGERERTRQRPPTTQRWAHVLAAVVVILASAVLFQHTLLRLHGISLAPRAAEDRDRRYPEREWAAVPEPSAGKGAKSPETPPAALTPMRQESKAAAPQKPVSAPDAGRMADHRWLATGNEQSFPGKGGHQEGLASRSAPRLGDPVETMPLRELERRLDTPASPGKRGSKRDWKQRAGEKKPELSREDPGYDVAAPSSVVANAKRPSDYELDEDSLHPAEEEAEAAVSADGLIHSVPAYRQRVQDRRPVDRTGRLQAEATDVERYAHVRRKSAKEKAHPSSATGDDLARLSLGIGGDSDAFAPVDVSKSRQTARQYLAQGAAVEGLHFQEATGYWQNTYVPGDPAMRLLETRLSRWHRRGPGGDLQLEKAAHQNWQPFDPPRNAALALYLHADQAGIQDRTRIRVQVGLKGTPRQGGLRPAMNLGLVLDLRALPEDDTGASIRALVNALHDARQPGDRFSVTVAGRPGALLVPAKAFRHGPIQLAMKSLFGGVPPANAQTLDLMEALVVARNAVQASEDPAASLGTSMILLVTASTMGAQLPALERFAHHGALEGIALSVAALGDAANIEEIDRLVRAGQGNRRILRAPDEATDLLERELRAVSRVVARAVRLRIRLAPHVKLIQVLGSRRLDIAQAQRVRQAERSIDQRVARNLGIKADRGEDEEGIQIVIPSFLADDTHVALLDVVAERPGFIADAQVRYKDLVFLRNGVARARLTVEDEKRDPGPLQLRVLKNRLAMELAVSVRQAGRWLASDNPAQAAAVLTWVRDLLQGMRYEVGGWSTDPDLLNDVTMVEEYLAMLRSPVIGHATERRFLADSLRYAAHRRLLSVAQ